MEAKQNTSQFHRFKTPRLLVTLFIKKNPGTVQLSSSIHTEPGRSSKGSLKQNQSVLLVTGYLFLKMPKTFMNYTALIQYRYRPA